MATFDAIFSPAPDGQVVSVNAGASSAEIVLGFNRIFVLTSSDDCRIKFGLSGMGAAATGDFSLWAKSYGRFDTAKFDRIRLFNPTAGAISIYILPLVH